MINFCKSCGDPFETDAEWKKTCIKCWLKENHPIAYEKKYLMKEIQCKRCGTFFWDEAWKTTCSSCWVLKQKERIQEDLEEREQFK